MFAPVTHILPLTLICRERVLPAPGKVLVRAQQKVGPTDTIAEANLNSEYLLLDIGRGLGLPADRADTHIHCQPGDQVTEKDILAGPVGLTRRVIRCPRDGRVILAGSGQILLEAAGKPFQLKAGLPGDVVDLIPDRGAIIETTGALIQGVWGNGKSDYGVLTALARTPDHEIKPGDLDVSMRGSIALVGRCASEEVLRVAEELPLRGLILSSAPSALIPALNQTQIPAFILEGFGEQSFNMLAFKLLASSDRREVAIDAAPWDAYKGVRPELVIPMPAPGVVAPPPESAQFEVGQTVRVRGAALAGAVGVIIGLKGPVAFPGGLRARAADVRLESGANTIAPLANLEVIA